MYFMCNTDVAEEYMFFYLIKVYLCDPKWEALDVYLYDLKCKTLNSGWSYEVYP